MRRHDKLDGHRLGIAEARKARQTAILAQTRRLMGQIDAAADIANANVLLHARAARSVIDSLNFTAEVIEDFHVPLGITLTREPLGAVDWREALRDPQQLKTAGKEAGQKAVMVGASALALALSAAGAKNLPRKGT